jgi:Uma2 family endonuclease
MLGVRDGRPIVVRFPGAIPLVATSLEPVDPFADLTGRAKYLEMVRGVLREAEGMGGRDGALAGDLLGEVGFFVASRDLGVVFASITHYELFREPRTVLMPDVSFIAAERMPAETWWRMVPIAPDFAAEVTSSTRQAAIIDRVGLYLEAGTRLVWLVRPEHRMVTVFRPDRPERIFGIGDVLDGEDVFPGYRLSVDRLFRIRGRRIP